MSKKQLFAAVLALSAIFSVANARALTGTTTAAEQQPGSSQDDEDSNQRLLEQFRVTRLSLVEVIAIAEQMHPGSRTASVSFELSASPSYRILTVKNNEAWENIIDASTGNTAGPEATLVLSDLEDEDRSKIIALRSIKQELSDAVRVAEKAASGKALGGGLVKQGGRLNFVVVVVSGDDLKEVMLEPPPCVSGRTPRAHRGRQNTFRECLERFSYRQASRCQKASGLNSTARAGAIDNGNGRAAPHR